MLGTLPDSITHLVSMLLNTNFVNKLQTLRYVIFDHLSPPSESLIFRSIPRSVTHLILSCDYSKPLCIGVLADTITHLAFGKKFNQPLSNDVLPRSLQYLHLSDENSVCNNHVKASIILSSVLDDLGWW